jgi:hypothetical protein
MLVYNSVFSEFTFQSLLTMALSQWYWRFYHQFQRTCTRKQCIISRGFHTSQPIAKLIRLEDGSPFILPDPPEAPESDLCCMR